MKVLIKKLLEEVLKVQNQIKINRNKILILQDKKLHLKLDKMLFLDEKLKTLAELILLLREKIKYLVEVKCQIKEMNK